MSEDNINNIQFDSIPIDQEQLTDNEHAISQNNMTDRTASKMKTLKRWQLIPLMK